MSTIGALDIPEELLVLWRELIRISSPRQWGAVAKNGHLLNPEQKRAVSQRSLLPEIRDLWNNLTYEQQLDWKSAGLQSNQKGWNLFVQDTSYRLKYGLPGLAIPDELHQYKAGKMEINAPATSAKLVQYHPYKYWKLQKVPGTKALYIDVPVIEELHLPLTIGLSYKSNMVATTDHAKIRYYAQITSHYQGRDIITEINIDVPLESDWARQTAFTAEVLGVARSYTLWLEFIDVRGVFYWDNVLSEHSGSNYARDYRCNDVNNTLTNVNYQIEKSWEEIFLPTGTAYDSVYPD